MITSRSDNTGGKVIRLTDKDAGRLRPAKNMKKLAVIIITCVCAAITLSLAACSNDIQVDEETEAAVVYEDTESIPRNEISDMMGIDDIETQEETAQAVVEAIAQVPVAPQPTAPAEIAADTQAEVPVETQGETEEMSSGETPGTQEEAPSLPYSQNDLDLLAALVWAEAGDQDFIGQRIVADCVMNRVRSGAWPGTVADVIYQPGQFSVVGNGRLSQGFSCANGDNYEAARLALSGDHYDTQVIYFSMYYCANGVFAYQHGDHFIGY